MKEYKGMLTLESRVKWTELFESEEELVEKMLLCYADVDTTPYFKLVQGYGFISSFQKYYRKNGMLTPKQMTQLKRLAKSIYIHLLWTRKMTYLVK